MKHYPSIEHEMRKNIDIIAFPKYDGQNVSALWTYKKGFNRFSSRTRLIDENSNELGKHSIPLMRAKEEELVFNIKEYFSPKEYKNEEFIFFFEFYGKDSFAGQHDWNKPLDVILIDLNVSRRGFVAAKEFVEIFQSNNNVAKPIYQGNITDFLITQVEQGIFPGMTFEGIVCKQSTKTKKSELPYMTKLKSKAWIDKIKSLYKDEKVLKELL